MRIYHLPFGGDLNVYSWQPCASTEHTHKQLGKRALQDNKVVDIPCRAKDMAEHSMRIICWWTEQAEVNRAAAALKGAQKAADKVVKAPWLAVFNDVKVKHRVLRNMRTQ